MKKILLGLTAAAAIATPFAAVAGTASAAQPTTTHSITMEAASPEVIDLPALNGQFTSMVITVNDGTAHWGADEHGYWTTYSGGVVTTGRDLTSGIATDPVTGTEYGPLLVEGVQVGAVVYSVDGGKWKAISSPITITRGKHVRVAYNDRPGSYDDNFGSLDLTVARAKG